MMDEAVQKDGTPAVGQTAIPPERFAASGTAAPVGGGMSPPTYAAAPYQPPVQSPYQPQPTYAPYQPQPPYQRPAVPNAQYPAPGVYQQPYPAYMTNQALYGWGYVPAPSSGKATAALVLGILSIVFSWASVLAAAAFICGIIGIILGASAHKALSPLQGRGRATAGLVCSIIGVVLSILFVVLMVLILGLLSAQPFFDGSMTNM